MHWNDILGEGGKISDRRHALQVLAMPLMMNCHIVWNLASIKNNKIGKTAHKIGLAKFEFGYLRMLYGMT